MGVANQQSGCGTPTIYDVAARAGVSIATVSRALNDSTHLRRGTRERVLRAVEELAFVPNGSARSLSSRSKEIVGLLFPKIFDDDPLTRDEQESLLYTDVVVRGAEHAAQTKGFSLLLSGVRGPGALKAVWALSGKADGLLLFERVVPEPRLVQLARRFPVVLLAGSGRSRSVLTVRVDNTSVMRELASHLVSVHGYRELAFVGMVPSSPDAEARAGAFTARAAELGASCTGGAEWHGDFTAAGGARAMRAFMETGRPLPRALACASDQTAVGVMSVLRSAGVRVPDDVAVTGFDDIPMARHLHPALTTVRQPMYDLGSTGVDALLDLMEGRRAPTDHVVLPTRLVRRRSCGCSWSEELEMTAQASCAAGDAAAPLPPAPP